MVDRTNIVSEHHFSVRSEQLKNSFKTDEGSHRDIVLVSQEINGNLTASLFHKAVSQILKKFGMHHAKHYPHDHRRQGDAEEKLKKPDSRHPEGRGDRIHGPEFSTDHFKHS